MISKKTMVNLTGAFGLSAGMLACTVPQISADENCQEGGISWYGPGFNGKRAANGEIFNEDAMTAAHRKLPFGTMIEVTSANGNTVELEITDRGPFHPNRILDVSKAAADKLGFRNRGVTTGTLCIQ